MTTQIKAGVIAANAVNSSELASGALSGQNFTGDVTFDTTTLKIDSSNNRVGIGTSSPSKALVISDGGNQGIELSPAESGTSRLFSYNRGTSVYTNLQIQAENLLFYTNASSNSEAMRIDSSGNVQIGTSSHVNLSGSAIELTIGTSGDTDNSGGGISFAHNGSTLNGYILGQKSSLGVGSQTGYTYIVAGGSERLRIDSSGNVGIGTSSPVKELQIGSATASVDANMFLAAGSNAYSRLYMGDATTGTGLYAGLLMYDHGNDAMTMFTSSTERMRIDTSGKVGIGTSSGTGSLHLTTKDSGGSDVYYVAQNTTNNRLAGYKILDENGSVQGVFRYDNGGNNAALGVGTGSPQSLVHVHTSSAGSNYIRISNGDTGSGASDGLIIGVASNEAATFWNYENTSMNFGTNGTERMRITANGRLLIGGTADRGSHIVVGGDSNTARVLPMTDNVGYIGDSTFRWQAIYANNSSIQTSDEREKTEIKETTLGLDFIKDLKPISYKWIDAEQCNKGKDEREHQGLIAQQVAEIVEKHGIDKNTFGGLDIQKTEKYNDFHGMSYSEFISPLIKAIQEQQTIIDDLKSRIDEAGL